MDIGENIDNVSRAQEFLTQHGHTVVLAAQGADQLLYTIDDKRVSSEELLKLAASVRRTLRK